MSLELSYQESDISKPSARAAVVDFLNSKNLAPKGVHEIESANPAIHPALEQEKNRVSAKDLNHEERKLRSGLIFGHFAPLHNGHLYLIDFAANFVDELTVLVSREAPMYSVEQRVDWLCQCRPDVNIVIADENIELGDSRYDYVFAGKPKAPDNLPLAKWGAAYIPVDPLRELSPACSRTMRENPLAHWQYLPEALRPDFVKRVCIFGPESVGKSTMTKNLAKHFETVFVPEYARTFMETRDNELAESDLPAFARGMMASEEALSRRANRLIFSDTDALTTSIWSNWLYKRVPEEITALAMGQKHDLYLLLDVAVPWVADAQRYLPEERQSFLEVCRKELERLGRRYVLISGENFEKRTAQAIEAVTFEFGV